jgi:hypothetical protein
VQGALLNRGLVEGVNPSRPLVAPYRVAEVKGLGSLLAEMTDLSPVKATLGGGYCKTQRESAKPAGGP